MCGGFKPIYVDASDKLARSTQEQIVGHNEHGEKLQCTGFVPTTNAGPFDGVKKLFNTQ